MRRVAVLSSAALVALSQVPQLAWAAAEGSSALTSLSYVLTDNDPHDGVVPAVTWTGGETFYLVAAQELGGPSQIERATVGPLSDLDVAARVPGASARAVASPTSILATAAVEFLPRLGAVTDVSAQLYFTLTPQTTITFTGSFALAAAASEVFDPVSRQSEGAGAWFKFATFGPGPTGEPGTSQGTNRNKVIEAGYFPSCAAGPDCPYVLVPHARWDESLHATFENLSSAPLAGGLDLVVATTAYAGVAPVPEPAAGVLLLVGLGSLACLNVLRRPRPGQPQLA